MYRKTIFIVMLVMITTLVLSACGPGGTESEPNIGHVNGAEHQSAREQ